MLTVREVLELPAVVDVPTAGRALGMGRSKAYELARAGAFPCRVLRAGRTLLVPTADLCRVLGLTGDLADTGEDRPVAWRAPSKEQQGHRQQERSAGGPVRRRISYLYPPAPRR